MLEKKKSPSKHIESDASVDRDDLALVLQKEMNKANKDGVKVAYFLDEEDNPWDISEWVSTGSTLLDLAISNRANGGLPVGKIAEISGLEGTGKSLICGHLIAETQKKGGLAVFFDSESAIDKNYWKALGVKVSDVPTIPFTTLEELFNNLELCIGSFRKNSKDRLLTVLVDSVAQASIEKEMEAEHGVDGYNTGKSLVLGKAMRKITNLLARQRILLVFTNQVRYNMNAGPFGDKWITPGGKALPFACSIRLRMANLGKIKAGGKSIGGKVVGGEVIGMKCQCQVIKSRCGPNFRFSEFEVHYDSGIQNLSSWLKFMKEHGIITGDGRGYSYTRPMGDVVEFNTNKFVELMQTDAALKEEIYQAICSKYIMQYRNPDSAIIENVTFQEGENDDITENAVKDESGT
jgi:recombination protein RecA